eukprot:scaffold123407_cov37-Attheya_sp.AAC.2
MASEMRLFYACRFITRARACFGGSSENSRHLLLLLPACGPPNTATRESVVAAAAVEVNHKGHRGRAFYLL